MGRAHKKVDDQELREQEVLRANRELAAYFKGQRTEREARAALKIIKAFIKDRERSGAENRRPLPGVASAPAAKSDRRKTVAPIKKIRRRSVRRPMPVPAPAPAPHDDDTGADESTLRAASSTS